MSQASEPIPLEFAPGVVKDRTRRAGKLTWYDTDKVRFVSGLPESIGGWQKSFDTTTFAGTCRSLFGWNKLDGTALMGLGTHLKYYVEEGGSLTDITPLRDTNALGANPIAVISGLPTLTITDVGHGANAGDYVTISGATAFAGLTTGNLNAEFQIATIVDADHYTVTAGANASSTTSGGGAGVSAAYQITAGLDTTVLGSGWGADGWSDGGWGEPASTVVQGTQLRVWTQDNWGEDLVINPRGYSIYYYDASSPARALDISTLSGASDTPVVSDQILVDSDNRQAISFGCNEIGSSVADPLFIRWSDTEDIANWTPGTGRLAAGGIRMSLGSKFMVAHKMRSQIATFTDVALYSLQNLGVSGYSPRLISDKVSIVGPKAGNVYKDVLYWKSRRGFWKYDGRVQTIECPLEDDIYRDTNVSQWWKVHAGVCAEYNEIWWFWPSKDSEEIDRYVIYNVDTGVWTPGTIVRTAYLESGVFNYPRAAGVDGFIYDHEFGFDDGSSPLNPFAESCIFPVGNGKEAMRIRQAWPDLDFVGSTASSPTVDFILKLQDKPGSTPEEDDVGSAVRTVTLPVEVFTDQLDVGKRGRFIALRYESNQLGTGFRVGVPSLDMIPDGRR